MTNDFGADPALVSDRTNLRCSGPTGFDPGDEAKARIAKADKWRSALVAFYERDECPMKARFIREGAPLDYQDLRTIDALEAAFIHASVAA